MIMQLQHLISKLQSTQDRMEIAAILVELAETAESNPTLQDVLRKAELPPPCHIFEYVKPSGGGKKRGYWARIPHTREHPSANQLQARLAFSEINYSLFGTKGTVERPDGTHIGHVNHLAGELMRGRKSVSNEERVQRQRQKAIDRIAQVEHFP